MRTSTFAFPVAILGLLLVAFLLAGLVLLLISLGLTVALGTAGLLFFVAARPTLSPGRSGSRRQTMPQTITVTTARTTTVESALALPPGLSAPASARMLYSSATFDGGLKARAVIQVESDIQPVLTGYYEKVSWERVAALMTVPHLNPYDSDWTAARLAKLECYRRTRAGSQDPTRQTALCYDRQAGRVYCGWIQKP